MKHLYKIIGLISLMVFALGIIVPTLMNIESTLVVFATVVAAFVVVLKSVQYSVSIAKAWAKEQQEKESE